MLDEMKKILKDTVSRIKDELLLFSIATIILLVFYSELKLWILMIYILGSFFYAFIKTFHRSADNKYLEKFENLLENSSWRKEIINHTETWFCDDDNSYQIEKGESENKFTEKWTQVYPDKFGSYSYPVYLKVGGVPIKQFLFVSCDGGRIFVPIPRRKIVDNKRIFQFNTNSLEYKLGKIIGDFYIYETIEKIAEMSKIEII